MILKSVTAHRIGPFYDSLTIEIDPRVTILTGANDAGKSSFLKAIELAVGTNVIDDDFANHDYTQNSSAEPSKDGALCTRARFELTESVDLQGAQHTVSAGDFSDIERLVARERGDQVFQTRLQHYPHQNNFRLKLPAIVKPGSNGEIAVRNEINLKQLNPLEKALLDVAFKGSFELSRYEQENPIAWGLRLRTAQHEINRLLSKVLPQPGMVHIELLGDVKGSRERLGVLIRDRYNGITPFGSRGAGVKRMISLLAELITIHRGAHHKIVLIDEPENSLHPDAQHLLREFLFNLTADGRTQVIYTTHSSAMVNPMRGEQVRLLYRTAVSGIPTTKLFDTTADKNFFAVRTALGLSAADSLLYAPVTVITEGITERSCLPNLILKLESVGACGVPDARKLLGLTTFLDGSGDSFSYLDRLARAHGTKTVLFLDGDKRAQFAQPKLVEKLKDVPLVLLPDQSEFEQLVPISIYLQALSELTSVTLGTNPQTNFQQWVESDSIAKRKGFTKQVERWFDQLFDKVYPTKRDLMLRAIAIAKPEEINARPIQELLFKIQEQLAGTSFE